MHRSRLDGWKENDRLAAAPLKSDQVEAIKEKKPRVWKLGL